ncbi:MAG: FtsL-like putative cell division protein [Bacteroidales bacterium]
MTKRNIIADLFGGQILLANGGLIKNRKLVIIIFLLIILIISIHYRSKDVLVQQEDNANLIEELKTEHISNDARILSLSKHGEIKKLLEQKKSTLVSPTDPPVIIENIDR